VKLLFRLNTLCLVMKYSVVSRDDQGQGEIPNANPDWSLTLVFFGRLECEMAHPSTLGRQDAGCIAPNGLGCNHSAGTLGGCAGQTGCGLYCPQRTRMQPLCWGPLRVRSADRMLQADFLRPDAMPIRLEQTLFLLM